MVSLVLVGHDDCYRDALCALLERDPAFQVRVGECPGVMGEVATADVVVAELWDCDPSTYLRLVREASERCSIVVVIRAADPVFCDELREAGALGVVGEWSPSGLLLHAIHEAVAGRCVVDPAFVDHVDPDGVLTRLESEVLALIGRGYTNQEIARALHRSVRSVEMHRAALVRKIGSRRRSDLVRTARMMGLAG
jgi:two-component system response regulator NreC